MNILAEKQLRMLENDISEDERNKRIESFNQLYFELRHKEENRYFGRLTLKARKRLHPLVLMAYIMQNHLKGFSFEIINNDSEKTNRPIIFAITHVGKFDIQVISEAIKEHYYLLSGDYEHIQGTIDAFFLQLNGVIYFNEKIKEDRASATERMIKHLNSGGNLMYFPEGTWNISPNLPVLPCYWGIVQIAQLSNAIIVPIAAEQYGRHFKINIGKNVDMKSFGSNTDEKTRAINTLRDIFATLKWEIWETEPHLMRKEIIGNEWKIYKSERFKEWSYFNEEYIDGLIFKQKNIVESEKAFEDIKRLSMK